ncbi:hypothetical protein T484DRAFT_1797575 [Baffinella frigidus]|nr:hypothetical protein T484DRAFT_1797575 [Cryptophyta sp. CCMP2293]
MFEVEPEMIEELDIILKEKMKDPTEKLYSLWSSAELDNILKETKKVPTEKYDAPATTSQEIGWHSMQGRKRFGATSCEITAYADAYSAAMGKNPFARKDPIVPQ